MSYYYAVVSVDSLGKKSSLTNVQNITAYVTDIQNSNTGAPYTYQLNQNYPNPFNPTTHIAYTIAKRGMVSLLVYDLLGREVSTLVNEVKEAGRHTVPLNGTKLSSGVYFYCLQAGSFSETKKLVLLR